MKRPLVQSTNGPERRVSVEKLSDEQIDKAKMPRLIVRDAQQEEPLPVLIGEQLLPSDLTFKIVGHVVQSNWQQLARLKTFMGLARVCKALRSACQRARYEPEHVGFRREARALDLALLRNLFPSFLAWNELLDWRWGIQSRARQPAERRKEAIGQVLRLANGAQLRRLGRQVDALKLKALYVDDNAQGVVPLLLKKLNDVNFPALETLRVGAHCTLQDERTLIAKCPALIKLDAQALPLAVPASLKCLKLAFFNSSRVDAKAWAAQASALQRLELHKLEDDSAGLLKLLAPQLRVLRIFDLRPLLANTLADLAQAPLQELELPLLRVPGPDYLALPSLPALFNTLSTLVLRLSLTNAQKDVAYFSHILESLASQPGLRSFTLELHGVPAGDGFTSAVHESLMDALRNNADLLEISVTLADGTLLSNPAWTRRALENLCYAPR